MNLAASRVVYEVCTTRDLSEQINCRLSFYFILLLSVKRYLSSRLIFDARGRSLIDGNVSRGAQCELNSNRVDSINGRSEKSHDGKSSRVGGIDHHALKH